MGGLDSGVAIELIGFALAECGYSSQSVEAIVDAIWSHDVHTESDDLAQGTFEEFLGPDWLAQN